MTSLLVVTGPPGAGKSTVARLLADSFDRSVLVEGDAFFGFLSAGAIPPWEPASHRQNTTVTRAAALATGEFVRGGYTTVYDGILGPWFLDEFLGTTRLDRLDYGVILPPVEVCVDRVQTRSGHSFRDEAATRHMHAQFADAAIDGRHLLSDDAADAGTVADSIRSAVQQGELSYPS